MIFRSEKYLTRSLWILLDTSLITPSPANQLILTINEIKQILLTLLSIHPDSSQFPILCATVSLVRSQHSTRISMAENSISFRRHDHNRCVTDCIAQVEDTCKERGARLTPIRRRVLEILLEEHRAMGAYDVLERLATDGLGSQPPIVYRALDFLVAQGFAHRIAHMSAFIACGQPSEEHMPVFLICRQCNRVAEADPGKVTAAMSDTASQLGFTIGRASIEAEGFCPSCQPPA